MRTREDQTQPSISVVIPVHNGEATLRRCLEAIVGSAHADFECLLVDDSSTDGTRQIAAEFPGVQVLELSGGPAGPALARNRGVEAARGEIICFIDADVVVHPDTLTRVAETFAERPDADAVFGSYDDSPGVPDFTSQYKNLFHHYVHQQGREEAGTFWAGCGAIRRGVFLDVGGFDERRYPRPCIEDIELGYRLRAAGHRILLNPEIQAKHLKRWTLMGIIRSDVLDRGIPWTLLILRHRDLPNDLNVQLSQRVSALLVGLMLLYLSLGAFFYNIVLLPLLVLLSLLVVGHWSAAGPPRTGAAVEITAFGLVGAIGWLAVRLGPSWMLVPLALLALGMIARRLRPRPGSTWTRAPFVLSVLALTAGFALVLGSYPGWLAAPLLGILALLVLLNRRFYLFFARKRGAIFALAVVPFHLLYYLYSSLALALGTGRHFWTDRAKRSA